MHLRRGWRLRSKSKQANEYLSDYVIAAFLWEVFSRKFCSINLSNPRLYEAD
jgi:hypothetical protein